MFNEKKFQASVELNSIQAQNTYTEKTPVVEIFSAIANGKDVSKYGKNVDLVYKYIKELGEAAKNGDGKAKVEINAITTIAVQAPLLKRLQLLAFMGNLITVGYNEEVKYKVYSLEGKKSGFQASQGDVPFTVSKWSTRTLPTETISGGIAINYRELATGNWDGMGNAQEQTIADMFNKIFYSVSLALYNGVKNATGIKHFSEASGVTKSAVDTMLKKIRRWGTPSIVGDYSVVSQLNDMIGFKADTTGTLAHVPDATMNEIMKTGLVSTYYKSPVIEIPNTYNLTKLNADGDNYETYLPEGLLNFLVSGEMSPLQVGYKGGLQSAQGFDVVTGMEMTRFDIEFGTVIIPEYVPMIGMVSDSAFVVDKG